MRIVGCVLAAVGLAAVCVGPAAASTATPTPAASPTAVVGSLGIRLLDVAVAAPSDPRERVYIVDHLAPGTVIHRNIEISNTTGSTMHVVLYSAAATIANGSFLGAAGHTANELSTWTSVRPGAAIVAPGRDATVAVTVAVPRDASPGEQYAVVWAEVRSAPSAAGGVIQVSRVGIRLYLSVGPGGPPASNFTINSLTAERSPEGRPMVLAAVHNTGGRALDMYGTLRLLAGPGGLSAGPFPATLGTTLAIGDTEPVTITLDSQLPAGPWDARITLLSGLLKRNARATITFPKTGAAPALFSTSVRPGSLYRAIAGVVILLVLLGVGTLLVVFKRRRRHQAPTGFTAAG